MKSKDMMRPTAILSFLFAGIVSVIAQPQERVKWKVAYETLPGQKIEIKATATIDAHWHIYATEIEKEGPLPTAIELTSPKAKPIGKFTPDKEPIITYDPGFKFDVGYHEGTVLFTQTVDVSEVDTLRGEIMSQACTKGQCLPPQYTEIFYIVKKAEATVKKAKGKDGMSSWSIFIEGLFWGILALLTPCVFPMIPMTVSFFLKGTGGKSKALFFGATIVGLYTGLALLITLLFGEDALNLVSTHWLPNLFFFLLLVVFAAAFFGAFNIVLPSWLLTKSDEKAEKGGFIGAFFVALTLVIASFSCTMPIVGNVLVSAFATGDLTQPIMGMLGFSLALALPFTFFAWFPSKLDSLPKSGGWLNTVKVSIGFIELALSLKFLSQMDLDIPSIDILPRELFIALWVVIMVLWGGYLLGKLQFSHDAPIPHISLSRLLFAIGAFGFSLYILPGMWGAPLKELSGYLPPIAGQSFNLRTIVRDEVNLAVENISVQQSSTPTARADDPVITEMYGEVLHIPHGLKGYLDWDEGLAMAKKLGKPVFVDFTGLKCSNCREMEEKVWSHPNILSKLRNDFVIVSLFIDVRNLELPEDKHYVSEYNQKKITTLSDKNKDIILSRYNTLTQPWYAIVDAEGNDLAEPMGYNLDKKEFLKFLKTGLKNK